MKNALKIALLHNNGVHLAIITFLFAYRRSSRSITGITTSMYKRTYIDGLHQRKCLLVENGGHDCLYLTWKRCKIKIDQSKSLRLKGSCSGETRKWKRRVISKTLGFLHYLIQVLTVFSMKGTIHWLTEKTLIFLSE